MASNPRCPARHELAARTARELSQRSAQVGAALQLLARCHIERGDFEIHLGALRRALAEARELAEQFDCADRVAAEAA